MNATAQFIDRRGQILEELAGLGPMRKGSLSRQIVSAVLKDGTRRQRGPYTLYTFKERGRTRSQRLSDQGQITQYQAQIATFRRFQELTGELARVGQQWADLEVGDEEGGKKNSES